MSTLCDIYSPLIRLGSVSHEDGERTTSRPTRPDGIATTRTRLTSVHGSSCYRPVCARDVKLDLWAGPAFGGEAMPRIEAGSLAAHRELVWTRLLDAFGEAVAERGYASVSLADVAQRAGVARNTIYNYASDKTSLMLAHAERSVTDLMARLDDDMGELPPAQRLPRIIRAHLGNLVPSTPGPVRMIVLEDLAGLLSPEVEESLYERFRPLLDLVADVIHQGVDTGDFRTLTDISRTVDLIVGVVMAARRSIRSGAHAPSVVDDAVDFVMHALT